MLQLLSDYLIRPDWLNREITHFFEPSHSKEPARINVYTSEDAARVLVSLPGWNATWFELDVKGNRLNIEGTTQFETENQQTIKRAVHLPFRVEEGKVEATYKMGILSIDLKRSDRDKPRKISVNAA